MRKDKVVSEVLGEEAAITPSDLYNMQFKTSAIGGYDKGEVDAFLERVGDVMEDLVRQVTQLRERCEEQRADIESFRELEGVLKASLGVIENYKQEILDAARREADALVAEARATRERAAAAARRLPANIAREARDLRDLRDGLRNNIRAILESHAILLERIPAADESVLDRFEEEEDAQDAQADSEDTA
jgi:cell division initiation protein